MKPAPSFPEPPRIKAFRLGIARAIPRSPNNRESQLRLEEKSLSSILLDYPNLSNRSITPRARAVSIELPALLDPRWHSLSGPIHRLLDDVRRGTNLVPYLSSKPLTRGFSLKASAPGAGRERWADKDTI